MSDEALEANETVIDEGNGEPSFDDLPDWAKNEIRSLRKEAGGRRTANKELNAEIDEYRKWKDQQKSELEKATERATQAEADLAELRHEKLQRDIAKEVGLDEAYAVRIRGKSKDEMLADAQELLELSGNRRSPDAFSGSSASGNRVVRAPASTEDQFKQWLLNQ